MMERLMWFNFAQKAVLGALVTHASPEAINTATEALEELAKNEKDAEGREIFEQIAASFKGITETP
ncbi:hypothetical protein AtDm6_3360 [Acetobacter tropicalis]|uniref:Uncharacterized protein n=2 Tax=Acetobacter tropicalis TaxID=104102 RepID=A0A094YG21_9PROT|nr:hypothetical protein AtDm6_3360 [Acetobacter tropicalis]